MKYIRPQARQIGFFLGRGALVFFGAIMLFVFAYHATAPARADILRSSMTIMEPILRTEEGDIDYHTLIDAPVIVSPANTRTGETSNYSVSFPVAELIPVGGIIRVAFPGGFTFSPLCSTPLRATGNEDINGQSRGVVTIAAIICSEYYPWISIIIGGGALHRGDYVQFSVQGVRNSNTALTTALTSEGYAAVIQTFSIGNAFLETLTSLPFFLTSAGTQTISGVVFNDNGSGLFGFANDGVQSGSEPGLSGAQVCLDSVNGSQCNTTDALGTYTFLGLRDGHYSISVPSLTTGSVVGGPYYVDVDLSGGMHRRDLNFAFAPAQREIIIEVKNIPNQTDVRVYASGGASDESGYVVRDILWNGLSDRTVILPVSDGAWSVGIESSGALSQTFIPPEPRQITVSGSGTYNTALILQSALLRAVGRVVDGSGTGISGAYVVATSRTNAKIKEIVTRSLSDGSFELNVASGKYRIDVSMPGMPPVKSSDIDIQGDSGNSAQDGNATADVYRDGTLVLNNLFFVVPKGEYSISGRVLNENGDPIASAVVSAQEVDVRGRAIGEPIERSTSATGLFTLFVSNGSWKLRAFAPVSGEIPSRIITVAGKNLSNQDLRVSVANLGTIKGTVTKGGVAAVGAFVSISGQGGSDTKVTDTNGRYSLRMKAGSGYTIEARVKGIGQVSPIQNVVLTPGGTLEGQDFIIQTTGTVIVTIPGVSDAYVDARDANRNGDTTTKNSPPGVYTINVPSGTYAVRARNEMYGSIGERSGVVVTPGGTTTVSFAPPALSVVSGAIVSSDSACVADVLVSAIDVINGRVVKTTVGVDGQYAFSFPDGAYTLTAAKRGCVDGSEPAIFIVNKTNKTLASRTMTRAAARIVGAVLLSDAYVALDTKVIAENSDGVIQSASVDTAVRTGNNYTLAVTPGTWQLYARADGYESAKHTISVGPEGKTVNMTLAIIPGYTQTEREVAPITPTKGGVVKNSDAGEKFAITIPAGSLGVSAESGSVSTKVTTAVVTKTAAAEVIGGKGIEISSKDAKGKPITTLTTAGSDATITIPYSKTEVVATGARETALSLAVWSEDKQQWTPFPTTVDTVKATLSGVPPHFSVFAPIVPVVSASTMSAVLEQFAQETEVPRGSVAPPATGIAIVMPQKKAQQQEEKTEEKKIVEEKAPTAVEEPLRPFLDQAKQIISTKVQPVKQEKAKTPKESKKALKTPMQRFPVRQKVVKTETTSQLFPRDINIFEASIAIDDAMRVLTSGNEIIVHGEIVKSERRRETVSLRFAVDDRDNVTIFDQREMLVVGDSALFTKTLQLGYGVSDGMYRITLEATYGVDIISSSDRFEVRRTHSLQDDSIQVPAEVKVPAILKEDKREGGRMPAAVALLPIFFLAGILWVWYTVVRLFHSL